jgi:hypothetical protein
MLQKPFLLITLALLSLGTVITVTVWKPGAATVRQTSAVYICRATGELFVGPGKIVPQIHPATGRATLWPALYCPRCETWSASPPTERLSGHPELLDCPKCKTMRSFDGAIPEGATEF